ncbi:hypothetical protein ACQKMV_07975 [Lysinibacillus sp. NPDC094403]|uniref:hypothetical protein n=1 Tax=Lysinibacillus sp. NPDC094403 TaxID=3390581 RepID=UPI003D02B12F
MTKEKKTKENNLQNKLMKISELSMKGGYDHFIIAMSNSFTILDGLGKRNLNLSTCISMTDLKDSNTLQGHIYNQNINKEIMNHNNEESKIVLSAGINLEKKDNIEIITFSHKKESLEQKIFSSKKKNGPSGLLYFEIENYSFLIITLNISVEIKSISHVYNGNTLNKLYYNRALLLNLLPIELSGNLRSLFDKKTSISEETLNE